MKSTELRIGNIVDMAGKIQPLTKELFVFILEGGDESFEPVPLKLEWVALIKNWSSNFEITFSCDYGNTAYDDIYITLNGERIKQIYHVHEAQNWHYLTTGKELTLIDLKNKQL